MNNRRTIRHEGTCGVCGISLHGIHGALNHSGRLLCGICHAKFGAVRHTPSWRMRMVDKRERFVNPLTRYALYAAALALAAVAAWLLS
ncbi:MAG: hypothetical protein HY291_01830 [Planctomycetes bacterium]|nr:hypothetical protein [Planctomycetota bacterium]